MKKNWALILFCVTVISGRLALVFYAGGPIPFHDQWTAEAQGLLLPYFRHFLFVSHLLAPNGEHVILPTRVLALILVLAEGRWDCITQMVVNCVLSPFGLVPLWWWTARHLPGRFLSTALLGSALLGASPLFYGNVIWGFQSSILLMIAFSTAHLYLVIEGDGRPARRVLGFLCGLLAAVSFASGFLCGAISALSMMATWRTRCLRDNLVSMTGSAVIIAVGLAVIPFPAAPASVPAAHVLHTLMHALSWPDRFYSWWALFFWAPFAAAFILAIRNRAWRSAQIFPLAAGAWGFAQALAISVGRSAPAVVMAPRYYDLFAVGIVANLLLLFALLHRTATRSAARRVVLVIALAWCALVGGKAAIFARSHTTGDVGILARYSREQLALIRNYYNQGRDVAILERADFPVRPFPDAAFLATMLNQPEIETLWPDYVTASSPDTDLLELPWFGVSRRAWFHWSLLIAALGAIGLAAGALRQARAPGESSTPNIQRSRQ